MRIRFRNSAFAAAFVVAVESQARKSDTIYVDSSPGLGELSELDGPVTLNVDSEKNGDETNIEIYVEDDVNAVVDWHCNDYANLNYSVNRVVPPVAGSANSIKGKSIRGYDVTLFRDGSVTVGCKSFSSTDVDRIVSVAKRRKSGIGFQEFRVTHHRIWPLNVGVEKFIGIDNDGRILPHEVEQIAAERAAFLATGPTTKALPAYNFMA
jgi:hypothetical protein